MEQLLQDTLHIAPLAGLGVLSLIVVGINSFAKDSEPAEYWVTMAGLFAVLGLAVSTFNLNGFAFNQMIAYGGFAGFVTILLTVSAILTLGLSRSYIHRIGAGFGEYYITVIFALMGMIAFATATDLIVTFVGLELMSVSLYILVGVTRKNHRSNEASLKYFLLGAFATGFFLYGIALMYGATGTTNIMTMATNLPELHTSPLFLIGAGMLLIGFAFKVGAVPFHMWVPDVYEGAPTSITAFMSTGAKAAAFAALLLVMNHSLNFTGTGIVTAFAFIATASMVVGNIIALAQKNVKRMLAYSSIAHAGYMLIGVTAGTPESIPAVLFYLASYTLTNIGAFGIVTLLEDKHQTPVTIDDFKGMGLKRPFIGILMSLFMFSLVGIPPLSGFFGKYYIFAEAIRQGYTWLTIVGVIASMISVYYYLNVVVAMYFRESEKETPLFVNTGNTLTLLVAAAGVLFFGFGPDMLLRWMGQLF